MNLALAILAGSVSISAAIFTLIGVMYSARAQKEPQIIKMGQEVAADAIKVLMRERDESYAKVATLQEVITELRQQLDDKR